MMVWLHTASPPQHVDSITETAFVNRGGCDFYLQAINETRGLKCEFCGVFENDKGETSVWVFDTTERAKAFRERNGVWDWII